MKTRSLIISFSKCIPQSVENSLVSHLSSIVALQKSDIMSHGMALNSQHVRAWNKKSLIFLVINQMRSEFPSFLFIHIWKCHGKHSSFERPRWVGWGVVRANLEGRFCYNVELLLFQGLDFSLCSGWNAFLFLSIIRLLLACVLKDLFVRVSAQIYL